MKIRSAKDVMAIAKARGFRIVVDPGPPPMPELRRPGNVDRSEVTDPLMGALRAWRLEIIEEVLAHEKAKDGNGDGK